MLKQVSNPPNPYAKYSVEWLGEPPQTEVELFEEEAKSIISKNNSPDLGFTYSCNPYRGCFHGCTYCYARPTHQYLDFGAGTDFEKKIIVKKNAPELLEQAFMRPSWEGEVLVFSGITDCYQPLEASYGLTRRCLEICLKFKNPIAIITKGALIRRDVELLRELAQLTHVQVHHSIPFLDDKLAKLIEPHAPRPTGVPRWPALPPGALQPSRNPPSRDTVLPGY